MCCVSHLHIFENFKCKTRARNISLLKGSARQCCPHSREERSHGHLRSPRCKQTAGELVSPEISTQLSNHKKLFMSKVSSVVDEATGGALDFTVDSPSINGEKLEVKVLNNLSLAFHTSCFVCTCGCNDDYLFQMRSLR